MFSGQKKVDYCLMSIDLFGPNQSISVYQRNPGPWVMPAGGPNLLPAQEDKQIASGDPPIEFT